jgi:nucleotide-binding universal stress UspA family protein
VGTILIGVDGSSRSEDAIVFGRQLADASDANVLVANAYPYSDFPSRAAHSADREQLRDGALEIVREMRCRLDLDERRSAVRIVADLSPAKALHAMAEAEDAALIVVGSTHTGRVRRVLPGSTGERLIHGSPCAVAVVPKEYRKHAGPLRRVGVAYNGTPEARAAAFAAAEFARALGGELIVIGVADALAYSAPALMSGADAARLREEVDGHIQASLDALVADLLGGVTASSVRLTGDPAEAIADYSEQLDLLVVGSRGYGPLRSVLVGGVSGRVIRSAHCPVIVLPRGSEAALAGVFASSASAGAVS